MKGDPTPYGKEKCTAQAFRCGSSLTFAFPVVALPADQRMPTGVRSKRKLSSSPDGHHPSEDEAGVVDADNNGTVEDPGADEYSGYAVKRRAPVAGDEQEAASAVVGLSSRHARDAAKAGGAWPSMEQFPELERLEIYKNRYLTSVPETLGALAHLQVLRVVRCPGIRQFPEALGRLGSLLEVRANEPGSCGPPPRRVLTLVTLVTFASST